MQEGARGSNALEDGGKGKTKAEMPLLMQGMRGRKIKKINGRMPFGEVPEWPIGPVSKTGVAATRPRVRIPPSPFFFTFSSTQLLEEAAKCFLTLLPPLAIFFFHSLIGEIVDGPMIGDSDAGVLEPGNRPVGNGRFYQHVVTTYASEANKTVSVSSGTSDTVALAAPAFGFPTQANHGGALIGPLQKVLSAWTFTFLSSYNPRRNSASAENIHRPACCSESGFA